MVECKEKFIGFIEILGWNDFSRQALDETNSKITLADLVEAKTDLADSNVKSELQKFGHVICPSSKRMDKDLDIEVTLGSGCALISSEISPAGIITLIHYCHRVVKNLVLKHRLLCRGFIAGKTIFHSGCHIGDSQYQNPDANKANGMAAFRRMTDDRSALYVEIDPAVCRYIKSDTDTCVNINFERLTQSDGEFTAVFPFKWEEHDFLIGDFCGHKFDPKTERKLNDAVMAGIHKSLGSVEKNADSGKSDVGRKALFYRKILERQLTACNHTDAFLSQLEPSFPDKEFMPAQSV